MYKIIFDKKAGEELEKLPKELSSRIFNKIIKTKQDPFRFFIRLKGREDYKLRIGDYRIIADIDQENKKIIITKIGHRKSIYDN